MTYSSRSAPVAFAAPVGVVPSRAASVGVASAEAGVDPGLRRDDVERGRAARRNTDVMPARAGTHASPGACGAEASRNGSRGREVKWGAAGLAALLVLLPTAALAAAEGIGGPVDPSLYRLMVFVMAIFVGYYVVWSVTPALHTPLMSVTNAISSVIVVGALLAVGVELVTEGTTAARIFGFLALVMASVNIFGGFLVTQRMLAMYKKKDKAGK
jgi:NAD(P) transhydrogenase subunit alpha